MEARNRKLTDWFTRIRTGQMTSRIYYLILQPLGKTEPPARPLTTNWTYQACQSVSKR